MAGAIATKEVGRAAAAAAPLVSTCCLGTAAVDVVDACRERRLEMMVGVSAKEWSVIQSLETTLVEYIQRGNVSYFWN